MNAPMLFVPLLFALALQENAPAEAPPKEEVPIPDKVHASPEGDELPAVTIRTGENGDKVEEYRQNGVLYMVKVTPERGPAYYLMDTDGNGRLNRDEGVDIDQVSPVYWTIYEWD